MPDGSFLAGIQPIVGEDPFGVANRSQFAPALTGHFNQLRFGITHGRRRGHRPAFVLAADERTCGEFFFHAIDRNRADARVSEPRS